MGPSSHTSLLGVLVALLFTSCAATPMSPPHECRRALYAATGETIPLSVEIESWMSSTFELVGYCLSLDGASLTMQESTDSSVGQRAGVWEGAVSREGVHELGFVAWLRGTGELYGYRWDVKSAHSFMVSGDPAPAVRVVLYEKPEAPRLEMRPTLAWETNAGMLLPPGKPPNSGRVPLPASE